MPNIKTSLFKALGYFKAPIKTLTQIIHLTLFQVIAIITTLTATVITAATGP